MEGLSRLRQQQNRIALGAMGRHSFRPRVYDAEVRADASLWDVIRLPIDALGIVPLQDATGAFDDVLGSTDFSGPGVI